MLINILIAHMLQNIHYIDSTLIIICIDSIYEFCIPPYIEFTLKLVIKSCWKINQNTHIVI